MTKIVVVAAGLGVPSTTRLLADRFVAELRSRLEPDTEIDVIELRDYAHAIADAMLTGFASGGLKSAIATVVEADALVAVTPVFNASYSGLFKSFFDVIEPGKLDGLPVLLAANGGSERHSLVTEQIIRPLFVYAHAKPVTTAVYAATSDFGSDSHLDERIARASAELIEMMRSTARTQSISAETKFVPFSELLG